MALKNLINGQVLTNMWVTGRTTKKKVLGFNTMPMVTSMKAAGQKISVMVKVHIGWLMPRTS